MASNYFHQEGSASSWRPRGKKEDAFGRQIKFLQDLGFAESDIQSVLLRLSDPHTVGLETLIDMLYDNDDNKETTNKSSGDVTCPDLMPDKCDGKELSTPGIFQNSVGSVNADDVNEINRKSEDAPDIRAWKKLSLDSPTSSRKNDPTYSSNLENLATEGQESMASITNTEESELSWRRPQSITNREGNAKSETSLVETNGHGASVSMAYKRGSRQHPQLHSTQNGDIGTENESIKSDNSHDRDNGLKPEELHSESGITKEKTKVASNTVKQTSGSLLPVDKKQHRHYTEEEKVRIRNLKTEQKKLLANKICNACHSSDINLLFLPCRHMVTCESCGEGMSECLKCGKGIIATVKIFML